MGLREGRGGSNYQSMRFEYVAEIRLVAGPLVDAKPLGLFASLRDPETGELEHTKGQQEERYFIYVTTGSTILAFTKCLSELQPNLDIAINKLAVFSNKFLEFAHVPGEAGQLFQLPPAAEILPLLPPFSEFEEQAECFPMVNELEPLPHSWKKRADSNEEEKKEVAKELDFKIKQELKDEGLLEEEDEAAPTSGKMPDIMPVADKEQLSKRKKRKKNAQKNSQADVPKVFAKKKESPHKKLSQ